MIGDDFNTGSFKSELWDNITGGDIRTAFEGNISSLFFNGAGRRFAQTRPLNTQANKSFEFDLIYGDGVNGWQATTFPVSLEYSVDNGTTWNTLQAYTKPGEWTRFKGNFPLQAQSQQTVLRWDQNNTFSAGTNVWAIDNIQFKVEAFEIPTSIDFTNGLNDGFWGDISSGKVSSLFGAGKSLVFSGDRRRFAQSAPINTLNYGSVEFDLIYGDGSNGGSDNGFPVSLEVSGDNGASWQELATFSKPTQWTRFKLNLPPSAKGPKIQLRWDQNNTFGEGSQQWAIDNITLKKDVNEPPEIVDFSKALRDGLWQDISNGKVNSNFAGRNQSLFFGGAGRRFVETVPLNTQKIKAFEFDLIYGDGTNGGKINQFPVSLEYSNDQGGSWQTLQIYDFPSQWTRFKINLPPAAQSPSTMLRWDQNNTFGVGSNVWAIDNLVFRTQQYQPPTSVDFSSNLDDGFWRNINNGQVNNLFPGRTKSLRFAGQGFRFVESVPLDTRNLGSLEFDLIYGNGTNGGGDNRFPISLEYSTDDGNTWFTIKNTIANSGKWAKQVVDLPAAARSSSTILRWDQNNTFGVGSNVWAIDNIRLISKGTFLSLSPAVKAQTEGNSQTKEFTFTVNRTGVRSGRSTVAWALTGAGTTPTDGADFIGAISGNLTFLPGQSSRTITVNVRGDLLQERDETFRVSLSSPTGAVITTAAATGTIRNDDLIGDATANTLVGTARAEFLDGRANRDTLTGGGAADVFGFRFGESRLSAPDVITDFGTDDKIDLFSASGAALPAPRGFSLVADNGSATTLGGLAAAVFADANFVPGNQALGANSAVFVRSTNAAIAGTYLVINNATPGLSERDDLMIKLTGVFPGRPGPTSLFFQI